MEVVKLFKEALSYPTKDWNKLLILAVLIFVSGIFGILINLIPVFKPMEIIIITLLTIIISIVVSFFVSGYGLSITRKTIDLEEEIPEFEWGKNLIDGIKVFILDIVYHIIPVIVTIIVAYGTGAFDYIYKIINYVTIHGSLNNLPSSLIFGLLNSFSVTFLIGAILFIIFSLLLLIATARLAETDSLVAAINMKDIFDKISEIGWGNFIIWIIVFICISIVIGIIIGIIATILGFIIGLILVSAHSSQVYVSAIASIIGLIVGSFAGSYIKMFSSRALGSVYNESK